MARGEATLLGHLLEVDTPVCMGAFLLTKTSPLSCTVYGFRKPPKGRVHRTLRGNALHCAAAHQCPRPVCRLVDGQGGRAAETAPLLPSQHRA